MAKRRTRAVKKADEIDKPDEFIEQGSSLMGMLLEHIKILTWVVVLIFGVAFAVYGVQKIQENEQVKATSKLTAAIEAVAATVASDEEKKSQPERYEGVKTFGSAEELAKSAAEKYDLVASEYGDNPVGRLALFGAGSNHLKLEEWDKVIEKFERVLKDVDGGDPLRAMVYEGLGYAYEGKGEMDLAVKQFGNMGKEPFNQIQSVRHISRIRSKQGKKDEARKLLTEMLETQKEYLEKEEASRKEIEFDIDLLGAP